MATKKKKDSVSIHERWVSEIPEQFISGKKKKPTKADIELAKRMAEMREREQRVEMARNINKHDLELWIKRNSEKYGFAFDEEGELVFSEEGQISSEARAVAEQLLKGEKEK